MKKYVDIERLKMQAVEFAKEFKEKNAMADFENYNYTQNEWCIVMNLAQIYYNLMQGVYSREQALQKQRNIISLTM